jgi:spore maturation protein B
LNVFSLVIPLLFVVVFLIAAGKRVKIYDSFVQGAKGAVPLVIDIFPYLAAIFLLTEVFEQSGLSDLLCNGLSPVLSFFGIPEELTKLVLIKPFSGSGATALLAEILESNPPDSYVTRCAAVCYGSSETVFYISAVYFSGIKEVKLTSAIVISLLSSFLGVVLSCFLCRFL